MKFASKSTIPSALTIVAAIVSMIAGCGSKDSKNAALPVASVELRDLFQRVTMQGAVESVQQQIVIAPYDGNIKKIFVTIGDKVKVNDPLVAVESSASLGTAFPLRASFAGTVTHIGVRLGEYVKAKDEGKVLVRLDDLDQLIVRAKISESDYPKLAIKQEATIAVQSLPQVVMSGEIKNISLAPSENKRWRGNESVQYEVLVQPKDVPKELRPGMSVVVDALTARKLQVASLSHEYLQRKGRKFFVTLSPSRESKEVEIGLQTDEFVEVIGIPNGTEVFPVDFYSESKVD